MHRVFLLASAFLLASVLAAPISFTSEGGQLYANGAPFKLKGVNWFGFETANFAPHGLWSVSADSLISKMDAWNMNAVRLPYSVEMALNNPPALGINSAANPDLDGKSSLDVMDLIIKKFASKKILVMLDQHRLQGNGGITELWYDGAVSEAQAIAAWEKLITRYANQWNVFAADIKNEPHGAATWGSGNINTDFDQYATRVGNRILAICPRMLVFVEGIQGGISGWWGSNLEGTRTNPVVLSNPRRVVYSPHVYGPGVFQQPYFSVSTYPQNMPGVWDATIAAVAANTDRAVIIGEWGGWYDTNANNMGDKVWMDAFVAWLLNSNVSPGFYWCLNPNSGDTGGLLFDDWVTPVNSKIALLSHFPSTDVGSLIATASGEVSDAGEDGTQASQSGRRYVRLSTKKLV